MWCIQAHGHYPDACQHCGISGPTTDLPNHDLHVKRIPQRSVWHYTLRSTHCTRFFYLDFPWTLHTHKTFPSNILNILLPACLQFTLSPDITILITGSTKPVSLANQLSETSSPWTRNHWILFNLQLKQPSNSFFLFLPQQSTNRSLHYLLIWLSQLFPNWLCHLCSVFHIIWELFFKSMNLIYTPLIKGFHTKISFFT